MEEVDGVKPDFMKVSIWEHTWIWVQVISVVSGYLLIMLCIGIVYASSKVLIDPAKFGIDMARGRIETR